MAGAIPTKVSSATPMNRTVVEAVPGLAPGGVDCSVRKVKSEFRRPVIGKVPVAFSHIWAYSARSVRRAVLASRATREGLP